MQSEKGRRYVSKQELCSCLLDMREASILYVTVAHLPIPQDFEIQVPRGMKKPSSIHVAHMISVTYIHGYGNGRREHWGEKPVHH